MHVRAKPLLIYDGDCGFCRRWIERWRVLTGEAVEYAASQEVGAAFPQIPAERFQESVVFVDVDGTVSYGALAVLRPLAVGGRRWPLWTYDRIPGVAALTERTYALVASRRMLASTATRWLWGGDVTPPRYELVRWLFLRGLGVIYLIAFVSLWVQVEGLIGSEGVLPLQPWLDAVAERYGEDRVWLAPTLFWVGASDAALHVVCGLGVVASVLLVLNVMPALAVAEAWVMYLSLYTAGQTFLGFQWDVLLLETGVLGFLLAPWGVRPGVAGAAVAPRSVIWLLRFLLFKLMLLSGLVKLASQDPVWWDLTALTIHYETQPIPAWTSWYVHQLPPWFHRICCSVMFFIELVVPFLIFAPRRPRLAAFALLVALQLVIIATGNYGFFNILTILLCVSLLDDAYAARALPERLARAGRAGGAATAPRRRRLVGALAIGTASLAIFVLSFAHLAGRAYGYTSLPAGLLALVRETSPFHIASSYGLFASMTTERPEIILEGSRDGRSWEPYEFRWKPGEQNRRPAFVAPHQPRLDWQMWFAALGDYRRNPWLISLMRRLLEGAPPVLALLEENPFADVPPRYVRAVVYDYRFTDGETRRSTGAWWRRENPRPYAPVLSRD
ncbi:MAG: DUF393 domain-containing protein [Myxococcales bacterium]|nr:MAG: DUF393 domain-containing protein [Myxococcales bacterium]